MSDKIEEHYITNMFWAIKTDDIAEVEKLLAIRSVAPNIKNNWALKQAASSERWNIVRLLMDDPRVDPLDGVGLVYKLARAAKVSDIVVRLEKLIEQDLQKSQRKGA